MRGNKSLLFLLAILGISVVLILILLISAIFSTPDNNENSQQNIPTPVSNTTNSEDTKSYEFTPLQKTVIGQTREQAIEDTQKIINQSVEDGVATFVTQSFIKGENNIIKTRNGVVIFESTRTDIANPPPPKVQKFKDLYGEPELVLDGVSKMGNHISAYIYASKGFTLFANRITSTVYDVHRYLPMSLSDYRNEYAEYLAPAPPYPQEKPDNAN